MPQLFAEFMDRAVDVLLVFSSVAELNSMPRKLYSLPRPDCLSGCLCVCLFVCACVFVCVCECMLALSCCCASVASAASLDTAGDVPISVEQPDEQWAIVASSAEQPAEQRAISRYHGGTNKMPAIGRDWQS